MSSKTTFTELALAIRTAAVRGVSFRDVVRDFLSKRNLSATDQDILVFQRRVRSAFQARRATEARAATSPEQEGEEDKMQIDTEEEQERIVALLEREENMPAAKRAKTTRDNDILPEEPQPQLPLANMPADMINVIVAELMANSPGFLYPFGLIDRQSAPLARSIILNQPANKLPDGRKVWFRILSGDMARVGKFLSTDDILTYQLEDALSAYKILFPAAERPDVIWPFIEWALTPLVRADQFKLPMDRVGAFHDIGWHKDRYKEWNNIYVDAAFKLCHAWKTQPPITDANVVKETLELFHFFYDKDITDRNMSDILGVVTFFFQDRRVSSVMQLSVAYMIRAFLRHEISVLCDAIGNVYSDTANSQEEPVDPRQVYYDANLEIAKSLGFEPESMEWDIEREPFWHDLADQFRDLTTSETETKAVENYDYLTQQFIDMVSDGKTIFRLLPMERLPLVREYGLTFFRVECDVPQKKLLHAFRQVYNGGGSTSISDDQIVPACLTLATPFLRGEKNPPGAWRGYMYSYIVQAQTNGGRSRLAVDKTALTPTQITRITQTLADLRHLLSSYPLLLEYPGKVTHGLPAVWGVGNRYELLPYKDAPLATPAT